MPETEKTMEQLRAALASTPRLDLAHHPVAVALEGGTVTLEGEAPSVAAKKRALDQVAAVPGITGIVDRLRVAPAQRMGDGEIRDLLRDALLQEPAFAELALKQVVSGQVELLREPPATRRGWIEISVDEGVVTLNGEVPGLGHKRLAGVLAWWVPGSRDVINGLAEMPAEADSDDEISDAVRIALEKDPFVNASQIRLATYDRIVTLRGQVPSESEKEMAEADAWYVLGVEGVINELAVKA